MNDLILDIKIEIASCDKDVWYLMYKYDEEFNKYGSTSNGRVKYVRLFTIHINKNDTQTSYLFGKLHSVNDLPAIITAFGTKCWYYYGKEHRENDLPAIIYDTNEKHWYYNGKRHRENDLPAIIYVNGAKYWYFNGGFFK